MPQKVNGEQLSDRITLRMTPTMLDRIKRCARRTGQQDHEWIRSAISAKIVKDIGGGAATPHPSFDDVFDPAPAHTPRITVNADGHTQRGTGPLSAGDAE